MLTRLYRYGIRRALDGEFELLTANLEVRLYGSALAADARDVDTYDARLADAADRGVVIAVPMPRSWNWDVDTRTLVLTSAVASFNIAAATDFRYAMLYEAVANRPLVLYDFGTDQALAAGSHDFDLSGVIQFRLHSTAQPAPVGADVAPLYVRQADGDPYRVIASTAGALLFSPSGIEPDGGAYLRSPNGATWRLEVNPAGTALISLAAAPSGADVVYDPLLLPTADPTVIYRLVVSDTGTLTTQPA